MNSSPETSKPKPSSLMPTFLATMALVLVVQTVAFYGILNSTVLAATGESSRILTKNLASYLANPLQMGEYDILAQVLEVAKRSDANLVYVHLMDTTGRVVASSNLAMKDKMLNAEEFDRHALQVTDLTRTQVPGNPSEYELAVPIQPQGKKEGTLRCIFNTSNASSSALASAGLEFGFVLSLMVVSAIRFNNQLKRFSRGNQS
jgi:hypothetical protein